MTLAGVELDTTQAFTVLSIFNALQFTISTLSQPSVAAADCGPGLSLLLRNSSYSWRVKEEGKEEEEVTTLANISLEVPTGQLVGIAA